MKKIIKLGMNITLLAVFLGIILLPTGFMGIIKYEENSNVLSAQDSKEGGQPVFKSVDDPNAKVPEDVQEMILKMEREYYQKQNGGFVEDIERTEEQELIETDEETPDIVEAN